MPARTVMVSRESAMRVGSNPRASPAWGASSAREITSEAARRVRLPPPSAKAYAPKSGSVPMIS